MDSPNWPAPWQRLPDVILLKIFAFMPLETLLNVSETCHSWCRVAYDELLWKSMFYATYKINRSIPRLPNKTSWRGEYMRLYNHIPKVESEVLCKHKDQVLHISFSHNGRMFASSSKDGSIKVWDAGFPAKLKYSHDLKQLTWKYTQYSQFNATDTLLLVSGVHFGSFSTSGEIAVFGLQDKFELQCRVLNKPYDIFGTWYNNEYLLSGSLYWLGHLSSCSAIWLNKANQAPESELESVYMRLFKFENQNGSSIRTLMVANCPGFPLHNQSSHNQTNVKSGENVPGASMTSMNGGIAIPCSTSASSLNDEVCLDVLPHYDNHEFFSSDMNSDYDSDCEMENLNVGECKSATGIENSSYSECSNEMSGNLSSDASALSDKYLIFTTGTKTYSPHLIGVKRLYADDAKNKIETATPGGNSPRDNDHMNVPNLIDYADIDHLIDLHGHIIGMCLSPDHRYLYVNSRPWPKGYDIQDPYEPPPLAQEIDIHVIDLLTMKEIGKMHHSHKAYTPNDECFFIFLDVSDEYVASGAEDKHGYLWDRHYGVLLQKFPHNDVVNSVAFNPQDPEVLVTASDDFSIKIWRSLNRERDIRDAKLRLKCRDSTIEDDIPPTQTILTPCSL